MNISLYKVVETKDGEYLEKITPQQISLLTSNRWVIFDPFEKVHIGCMSPEAAQLKYTELQTKLDQTPDKSNLILEAIEPIEPRESITQSKDHCFFERI